MRPYLPALATLTAALALCAPSGHAATVTKPQKPQVVDPKGDVVVQGDSFDVLSATVTTSGYSEVTRVGKRKVVSYMPKELVVRLTLAGPPAQKVPAKYAVQFDVAGCGTGANFQYTPGLLTSTAGLINQDSYEFFPCGAGSGTALFIPVTIVGNSITFTVGLDQLPFKRGTVFSNFRAYTAFAEPVTGVLDTGLILPFDDASAAVSWKLP